MPAGVMLTARAFISQTPDCEFDMLGEVLETTMSTQYV